MTMPLDSGAWHISPAAFCVGQSEVVNPHGASKIPRAFPGPEAPPKGGRLRRLGGFCYR